MHNHTIAIRSHAAVWSLAVIQGSEIDVIQDLAAGNRRKYQRSDGFLLLPQMHLKLHGAASIRKDICTVNKGVGSVSVPQNYFCLGRRR